MAALILLVVVAAFLWASWVLMRNVAKLPTRWQWSIAAALVFLILLEVMQLFSGYALAIPGAPFFTVVFAVIAYVLAMFFLWQKLPLAGIIGLALPLVFIRRGLLVVLLLIVATGGFLPSGWGRISPTLSYQIVESRGMIGRGTVLQYRLYRNPRWFPLIQKRVRVGLMLCPDATFEPGTNEHTVRVTFTCNNGPSQATEVAVP